MSLDAPADCSRPPGTMSDFFKSAMGYFNSPGDATSGQGAGNGIGSAGGGGGGGPENDFVGQLVEVDTMKLRIKRLIAMGKSSGN